MLREFKIYYPSYNVLNVLKRYNAKLRVAANNKNKKKFTLIKQLLTGAN
jgi:hypothetical protein